MGSGRKKKNYATLRKISQSKKCKEAGSNKYRAGAGIKGRGGKREDKPPVPSSLPPPS